MVLFHHNLLCLHILSIDEAQHIDAGGEVGSWELAVGSWELAVGSWQLAVGSSFERSWWPRISKTWRVPVLIVGRAGVEGVVWLGEQISLVTRHIPVRLRIDDERLLQKSAIQDCAWIADFS